MNLPESDNIQVLVKAQYVPEQSRPDQNQYVYAYTIELLNKGDNEAQLISRHWYIVDEKDQQQEVQGLGVIGKQPVISPGKSYTYTSGVVLPTKSGTMSGSYTMKNCAGEEFETAIPTFALVQPHALH
ncbi:MAG: Co2+/Mg2+ efflux protein ApaG [Alteromonadaceae bacterium]|nr:MAG: Co2+/Mg2+ efflux protein ApaG [Alteromonadaceae bacterium]